jgi:predicted phosphodiesterase
MLSAATRALVVSDVHYELVPHHGVDESGAFGWLFKTVKQTNPDFLIGLGDWGSAWTMSQWFELAKLVRIFAIYGNHENIQTLRGAVNTDGKRVLVEDGGVRVIEGLRFGFINGIVSEDKPVKQGVSRKTAKEYLSLGSLLSGIDVLCTHESPFVPEYHGRLSPSPGTEAMGSIIGMLRPKLALSGHLTGSYTLAQIGWTVSLRIESSPTEKHFAVLKLPDLSLQVYHDRDLVLEKPIS